jgi:type I restriction enzyme S subunit
VVSLIPLFCTSFFVFGLSYVKRKSFYEKNFEEADRQQEGKTNSGGVISLRFRFSYRKLVEQQKIADCLVSLDELITLEAQKLDTLKTYKKGLMQQLFPAEGETLPKLRFSEFRDAGEWVEKALSQLGKRLICCPGIHST